MNIDEIMYIVWYLNRKFKIDVIVYFMNVSIKNYLFLKHWILIDQNIQSYS